MKKHYNILKLCLLVLCLFSVLLCVSCAKGASYDSADGYKEYDSESDSVTDSIISAYSDNRKIHFDISYNINSDDVSSSLSLVNSLMKTYEGYIESNDYNSYDTYSTASVVIRIPSDKLDSFIADFEKGVGSYEYKNISSTDYTTQYIDTTAKIESLQATRARYVEMLDDTDITFSLIQEINDEITSIDNQLKALEIKKNNFDNLVEYSTVTIKFNQSTKEKFFDAFDGYGEYIYKFAQVVIAIILYTLPFAVIAGIVLAIIYVPKYLKKKKNNQANKEENN